MSKSASEIMPAMAAIRMQLEKLDRVAMAVQNKNHNALAAAIRCVKIECVEQLAELRYAATRADLAAQREVASLREIIEESVA